MASSSGTPVPAIARLIAADADTVRDVIHAFNERGPAALDPQWVGGRPPRADHRGLHARRQRDRPRRRRPDGLGAVRFRWLTATSSTPPYNTYDPQLHRRRGEPSSAGSAAGRPTPWPSWPRFFDGPVGPNCNQKRNQLDRD
ncbi:helix-turn-helix domain-containing protein [Pseudonocardia xishanensis]|uniref:Winged helix-turn helix protein n=1 Tax=Pseudonocardia xishanensis TaxID=630995 RepID=A0ABP8S3Q3_9PSEU